MDFLTALPNQLAATDEFQLEKAATSDRLLVEAVLAGDETAFEEIFERHKRLVAYVAARFFKQPAEIEEIIQISFSKAYFELDGFRCNNDFSLASFLARIATNTCIDALRKRKRQPEKLESEFLSDDGKNVLDILHSENKTEKNVIHRDLAEKLLSRLASEDRALLEMLDAEEMSVKEVAQITGWSAAKVKIKAFRARAALRKILKKFV